jgi:hypothetical protein
MAEILGEYVDRLVTVEMSNRAFPRGITRPLYEAALREGGGRPITLRAAEELVKRVHRGDNVFLITGAGYPPVMPKGESDGPPGVAALARMLYKGIGATPIYLCEPLHADPIMASSEAAGVPVRDYATAKERRIGGALISSPTETSKVPAWAATLYDTYKPAAVISSERLGPTEKGIIHGATGLAREETVNLSPLITEAERRGVFSIGVGDNGNELGFGRIHAAAKEIQPYGKKCQCPCQSGNITIVKTDILLPAFISNWGCYGIEAMLAYLLRRPDLMQTPRMAEEVIRACIEAGGIEAVGCTKLFGVDGADGETSVSVVQMLGNMVRITLEDPDPGPAH